MAERRRVILDLCSGLGGASEAFRDLDKWLVIRIENNPALKDVPHTQLLDVLEWTDWIDSIPHPEIIWASPPCTDFSRGFDAPAPTAQRNGEDFEPDLSILRACMDIIDYFKPKWWIIENVQGAQNPFAPLLRRRAQRIGPFYLWGVFPHLALPYTFTHSKVDGDTWSDDPLRPNRRAFVPLDISLALCRAVEDQMTLEEWS